MSLFDTFPHAALVDGKTYELNTDYRVGLKIMQVWEDTRLTNFEKQALTTSLLFVNVPENFYQSSKMASKFLDCGKTQDSSTEAPGRVYSFTRDESFIYSAFLQTYGVDLRDTSTKLHWWKFVAMFNDLGENTAFERIVGMRNRYLHGKLTKEEREMWYRMAPILDLDYQPDDEEVLRARENFEKLLRG